MDERETEKLISFYGSMNLIDELLFARDEAVQQERGHVPAGQAEVHKGPGNRRGRQVLSASST
jgi:hypothetical protein